jgi:hypothetical protein
MLTAILFGGGAMHIVWSVLLIAGITVLALLFNSYFGISRLLVATTVPVAAAGTVI